jgi:NADH-quinone oxidoreductase subunit L
MTALALPLLPLGFAAVIAALHRHPRVLGPLAIAAAALALALGIWAALTEPALVWRWSPAISLGLSVAGFARVMVVLVPAIELPVIAYAAAAETEGRARLLSLMTAFLGAMLLLVTAADFVGLLIAWELVGAFSWALIAHGWRTPENPALAGRVFVMTRFGDLGLYLAAGFTFAAAGGFAFGDLATIGRPALDVIAAGVLLAAAAKSAQLPFSPWLFWAMAAPTPVSALLHSATMVAAGAYLLIILAPALEPVGWFLPAAAGIGLATALVAGFVAAIQRRVKQVLAGSTSAQYGLVFLAVGAGSIAAGGAHLVAHAVFKSLLFLGAGVALHAVGSNQLADMRLGRALRGTAMLSLAGALALAAVPPLGAAWTKEQVVSAAVHVSPWLGVGIFGAAFLSALYAARYQLLAFGPGAPPGGAARGRPRRVRRPSSTETAAMGVLAAATILLSVLWLPGAAGLVETVMGAELAGGAPWELVLAAAIITVAAGLAWWLWRRDALVTMGLPPRAHAAAEDWLGLPAATRWVVAEPVLALSRALARIDDRVIDAGVRGVVAGTSFVARLFSSHGEWTFDGAVHGTANATLRLAGASRVADDRGIDAAVEQGARGVGVAGAASRRLQTGMAHHYYVIVAAGLAAVVLLLLLIAP